MAFFDFLDPVGDFFKEHLDDIGTGLGFAFGGPLGAGLGRAAGGLVSGESQGLGGMLKKIGRAHV